MSTNLQQMGANIEQVKRSNGIDISKFRSEMCTSQQADGIRLELEERLVRLASEHSAHGIEIGRLQQGSESVPTSVASLKVDTMSECAALATQTKRNSASINDLRKDTECSIAALRTECPEDRVARKEAAEAKYLIRQCEAQQLAIASTATNSAQSVIQVTALRDQVNILGRDVVTIKSHHAEVAR